MANYNPKKGKRKRRTAGGKAQNNNTKIDEVKKKIPSWIKNGFSSKEDIDLIEEFGKYIAKDISTTQLRNVYGEVIRLKMQPINVSDMLLLRPKLAYAAARSKSGIYQDFQKVMSVGIDTISKLENKDEAFKRFADVFEALIAYHKQNRKGN